MSFIADWREKFLQKKGLKLLTKGKVEKALELFQKAILIDNSTLNMYNISLALMTLARYEEAEKYLLQVYKDYPENEMNTLTLGECEMMLKKWDKALTYYQKAAQKNSKLQKYVNIAKDSVAREKYTRSKQLFNQATLALKQREYEKALQTLLEAEEYFPENPNILHNIGSVYFLIKKYKKAYEYILKAHSLDKSNPKYQSSLNKVKRKLKRSKLFS